MEEKTVQDVINEVKSKHRIIISAPLACQLINDAVSELVTLYTTALVPTDIEFTNVKGGEPQIFQSMGVYKVMSDGKPYKQYTVNSNTIIFANDGNYMVSALMLPDNVEGAQDEIPVHMAYHPCIVQYVAFYADQGDQKRTNDQFYLLSKEIHNRLSNTKLKGKRVPARLWR